MDDVATGIRGDCWRVGADLGGLVAAATPQDCAQRARRVPDGV